MSRLRHVVYQGMIEPPTNKSTIAGRNAKGFLTQSREERVPPIMEMRID